MPYCRFMRVLRRGVLGRGVSRLGDYDSDEWEYG